MKLLMVIERYAPIWGGAENQLKLLNRYLGRHGYDVAVVTRRWSRELPAHEIIEGVLVRRLGPVLSGRVGNLAFAVSLFWHLLRHSRRGEVVHSHGAAILGALSASACAITKARSVTKIATAGKVPALTASRFGQLVRKRFMRADVAVCLSSEIHDELLAIGFPNQIAKIPNAVDTERFRSLPDDSRRDWRKAHGFDPEQALVLFSGRLVERKGAAVLLEAWSQVIGRHPDAHLILLGSGDGQPDSVEPFLRQKAKDISNITFAGATDVPEEYLGSADVFVLPSFKEGFPNVLLEAMSARLPCISSRIGGAVDLIDDGKTGLLFEAGNADELAECLNRLLSDQQTRADIAMNGQRHVEENFSMNSVFEAYHDVYRGGKDS